MRHMMGGNPLYLGGLADNVTALTRVLRSLYHHFTITLQSLKQASVSPVITNDSVPQDVQFVNSFDLSSKEKMKPIKRLFNE